VRASHAPNPPESEKRYRVSPGRKPDALEVLGGYIVRYDYLKSKRIVFREPTHHGSNLTLGH
jgi:hypothetical protein